MEPQTFACRIGAGLSTSESAWDAATEAAREARAGALGGAEVDLAFVFLSPGHLDEAEAAAEAVREELAPRHLLGCVAEGVVAGVRELEQGPGVAVWAGALPGAEIECFHAAAGQTEEGTAVAGFPELEAPGLVALLVDPFTFPVESFLTRLNEAHERIPLVGGIAAGGGQPGAQALILDEAVHAEGAVGAVVSGLPVLTVVSQGCRPIGREAVITRCEGNFVYELAGKEAASPHDRFSPIGEQCERLLTGLGFARSGRLNCWLVEGPESLRGLCFLRCRGLSVSRMRARGGAVGARRAGVSRSVSAGVCGCEQA